MLKNLQLLQRLKIWQKLVLIAVFMGLPIPFLAGLYVTEKNKTIEFAQRELYGTEYLSPLHALSKELIQHRALTNAFLRGETRLLSQLNESAQAVERQLLTAEALDRKNSGLTGLGYGALLQTSDKLRTLRQQWEELKNQTQKGAAKEVFDAHSKILADLRSLIVFAGDQSNLILDPDLDTYYLMDAVVIQIPRLTDEVGRLQGLGAGLAAEKKATAEELGQAASVFDQVQASLQNLESGLSKAYAANPSLKEQHAGQAESANKEAAKFAAWASQQLPAGTAATPQTADVTQFLANGKQTIEALQRLNELALNDLSHLLQVRASKVARERNLALGLTVLGLLLTALAVTLIARGINRQTRAITQLIVQIDSGNFEERAPVLTADELGRAAQAFNTMLDNTRGLMQSRSERDEIQRSIMKLLDEVSGVARGDLSREAEVTDGMTGAIADAFNYMTEQLRNIIGKVQTVAREVNVSASATQHNTQQLAEDSKQRAEQLVNAARDIDAMAFSIRNVAETAEASKIVARKTLETAQRGSKILQHTVKGVSQVRDQVQASAQNVKQLGDTSREIGEVVQVLEEIAKRTNVLALHASIQAASAGEAGRGFAVVVREVEHLAARLTEAAKLIGELVKRTLLNAQTAVTAMEESSRGVQEGTGLICAAGDALLEIEQVLAQLAELVQSISRTTEQQTKESAAVSATMLQLSEATRQTATGISRSALTATQLAALADDLNGSVASFKLEGKLAGKLAAQEPGTGRLRRLNHGSLRPVSVPVSVEEWGSDQYFTRN